MPDASRSWNARVDILLVGSPGPETASTCSLVREDEVVVVIDPGLSPSQAAILAPLSALGIALADRIVSAHGAPFTPSAATPR